MSIYKIGKFVEFGYNNGSITVKCQGKIITADNMIYGYEYDIMDENNKMLYKHVPESYIYCVLDGMENTINENAKFYCLTLDDFSAPSFCSFEKQYFGSMAQISLLIDSLEADEKYSKDHADLIQNFKEYCNGNTKVKHCVANGEMPLLEPVSVYSKTRIITGSDKTEHLNTWDLPYYLRWRKAESEHIWLSYGKLYLRCIKACFTKLQYAVIDSDAEYQPVKVHRGFGFPDMIYIKDGLTTNRLFVIEKNFENEEDLFQDIENFATAPDPVYTEIFDDVFGDG